MKIEKGYTLSEFIDLIEEFHPIGEPDTGEYFQWLVWNYNKFLKQPLRKEMFINEYDKPNKKEATALKGKPSPFWTRWEESEKKVIFKGYLDGDYYINNNIKYHFKDLLSQNKINGGLLLDLFQAKGELELKNVELK